MPIYARLLSPTYIRNENFRDSEKLPVQNFITTLTAYARIFESKKNNTFPKVVQKLTRAHLFAPFHLPRERKHHYYFNEIDFTTIDQVQYTNSKDFLLATLENLKMYSLSAYEARICGAAMIYGVPNFAPRMNLEFAIAKNSVSMKLVLTPFRKVQTYSTNSNSKRTREVSKERPHLVVSIASRTKEH